MASGSGLLNLNRKMALLVVRKIRIQNWLNTPPEVNLAKLLNKKSLIFYMFGPNKCRQWDLLIINTMALAVVQCCSAYRTTHVKAPTQTIMTATVMRKVAPGNVLRVAA